MNRHPEATALVPPRSCSLARSLSAVRRGRSVALFLAVDFSGRALDRDTSSELTHSLSDRSLRVLPPSLCPPRRLAHRVGAIVASLRESSPLNSRAPAPLCLTSGPWTPPFAGHDSSPGCRVTLIRQFLRANATSVPLTWQLNGANFPGD